MRHQSLFGPGGLFRDGIWYNGCYIKEVDDMEMADAGLKRVDQAMPKFYENYVGMSHEQARTAATKLIAEAHKIGDWRELPDRLLVIRLVLRSAP